MALETQVDRLSRQVAAETTEKRKSMLAHDELAEKCKQLSFQLEKTKSDIDERDQKVCPGQSTSPYSHTTFHMHITIDLSF